MSGFFLDDSFLDEVNGGFGERGTNLPEHLCGGGKKGKLVADGFTPGGKSKYKCQGCNKTGQINFMPGTRLFCELN